MLSTGKHLTYVRSFLKAGADLSAHIEQISNVALGFNDNNTISVRYTYNKSESVLDYSSMLLIQSQYKPSMDTVQS
jgi:hypothetical protein